MIVERHPNLNGMVGVVWFLAMKSPFSSTKKISHAINYLLCFKNSKRRQNYDRPTEGSGGSMSLFIYFWVKSNIVQISQWRQGTCVMMGPRFTPNLYLYPHVPPPSMAFTTDKKLGQLSMEIPQVMCGGYYNTHPARCHICIHKSHHLLPCEYERGCHINMYVGCQNDIYVVVQKCMGNTTWPSGTNFKLSVHYEMDGIAQVLWSTKWVATRLVG